MSSSPVPGLLGRLSDTWWRVRLRVKNSMPLVRRQKLNKLSARFEDLLEAAASAPPASEAGVRVIDHRKVPAKAELCLFVTHTTQAKPKPHVVSHVAQLLDAGIEVILIVAKDGELEPLDLPGSLKDRLVALVLRENVGFDFAAWSHAYQLLVDPSQVSRLLMVNDSMVGPLDRDAYSQVLQRMRACAADVVGMTFNPMPRPHIQSYFFAFGSKALASPAWRHMWSTMRSFPTKEQVIDVYETQLTRRVIDMGLSTATLFPLLMPNPRRTSDVHYQWKELVAIGFPFVKGNVVREQANDPDLMRLVPEAFRRGVS